MSGNRQRRYRFANAGQWGAGLGARVNDDGANGIAPFISFGDSARLLRSPGAYAPAAARDGAIVWLDGLGALLRFEPDDQQARSMPAPIPSGRLPRIVLDQENLWFAAGHPVTLRCHDSDGLARRFVFDFECEKVLDIASDGNEGVWALAESAQMAWAIHVDCAGYEVSRFALDGLAAPTQLAWLAGSKRLVVLAAAGKQLHWFVPGTCKALLSIDVDNVRPCFTGTHLGSDMQARILLAGLEHAAWGGGASVLALDGDGEALHTLELPAPATGIHASAAALLVTTADGLLRYGHNAAAGGMAETSCVFITPALQSPVNENPRRWLRAEALVALPAGTSMEISYAATSDPEVHEQALRIAADSTRPAARRVHRLREHLRDWSEPVVFQGAAASVDASRAIPLFDVRDAWLWIRVTLVAAPDAAAPRLQRLDVLYPGLTLMEYLPQVYQRAEAEPGNFLRALVGVMETTTQDLDARIAAMGSMIDPDTAPSEWLDHVAQWLGLPWDDALEEGQKRRLLKAANQLATQRGTRAGLVALLEALMPGTPARYRITDVGADYGFATLGAAALPSVLAGLPSSALALNRKAVIGKGRLTCPSSPPDDASRLAGLVKVDVNATAAERARWEPWLESMLRATLPVTARLALHWRSVAARLLDERLGDDYVLDAAPRPRLGTDAVTGLARL